MYECFEMFNTDLSYNFLKSYNINVQEINLQENVLTRDIDKTTQALIYYKTTQALIYYKTTQSTDLLQHYTNTDLLQHYTSTDLLQNGAKLNGSGFSLKMQ